jgi:hypothetical protein
LAVILPAIGTDCHNILTLRPEKSSLFESAGKKPLILRLSGKTASVSGHLIFFGNQWRPRDYQLNRPVLSGCSSDENSQTRQFFNPPKTTPALLNRKLLSFLHWGYLSPIEGNKS